MANPRDAVPPARLMFFMGIDIGGLQAYPDTRGAKKHKKKGRIAAREGFVLAIIVKISDRSRVYKTKCMWDI